jgi:hypothetical protein
MCITIGMGGSTVCEATTSQGWSNSAAAAGGGGGGGGEPRGDDDDGTEGERERDG